jgi:feruloyl esterase
MINPMRPFLAAAAVLSAGLLVATADVQAAGCEALASLALPHAKVTLATPVAAGAYVPPPAAARPGITPPSYSDLPAFCRVQVTARPTEDSDIRIEVWLPEPAAWNNKLRGTGNGGLGGSNPNPVSLANGLRAGFVTAGNNTGHEGNSAFVLEHPEKVRDFGYRAAHEMVLAAKALTLAYYGRPQRIAYAVEGGGGTMAALSAVQRHPGDYDAVAVTGLATYLTHHVFTQMWMWQATHQDEASLLAPAQYAVLNKAALAACDADDGLRDGLIGDPLHCRFDPATALCKAGPADDCLSGPQVEAARKIYAGPRNPRTGEELYSPMYPGSEPGWGTLAGGAAPLGIPVEFFRYYAFRDPAWDYKSRPVNFDTDVALADSALNVEINSTNPDLNAFFDRGGKLAIFGGWNDNQVPPKQAVDYYDAVVKKIGARKAAAHLRLFMVPGMQHGPGKAGAENMDFDALQVLTDWHEHGAAPDRLVVTHYKDGNAVGKRLVCPFPQVAYYRGRGDTEEVASWNCRQPAKR